MFGDDAFLHIHLAATDTQIVVKTDSLEPFSIGEQVSVRILENHLHLFDKETGIAIVNWVWLNYIFTELNYDCKGPGINRYNCLLKPPTSNQPYSCWETLIKLGLNLVQFLFLISWYNGDMIQSILQFISHLLFIYISYHLLITTVDWARWLKVTGDNQPKINMLILFIAIALGYLVSTFFLELLLIGRSFATMS